MTQNTTSEDEIMDTTQLQEEAVEAEQEQPVDPAIQAEQDAMASLAAAMSQSANDIDVLPFEASLEPRVKELEEENASLRDKAIRAAAEVENIRRRSDREKQETSKFAVTNFARDMISVFENLTRASMSISEEARQQDQQLNNLAMGVDMTLSELTQAFSKHKIQRIDPTGQPFDHNLHQAMKKVETADHPEGTVVQMMQAAYTIHDRLLQPAMVAVATAPKENAQTDEGEGDTPTHVDTKA